MSEITYKNVLLLDDNGVGLIPYMPPATNSTLGTVKVGANLTITEDGTLNATGGGGLPDTPVGSTSTPIYYNGSKLTPITGSVANATRLMYLSSGTFTASSTTVGNSYTPVYLNSGSISTCTTAEIIAVTQFYHNTSTNTWYRVWNNGFCEQGGFFTEQNSAREVSLLKSYKDTGYHLSVQASLNDNDTGGVANVYAVPSGNVSPFSYGKSTTSFRLSTKNSLMLISWYTAGFTN